MADPSTHSAAAHTDTAAHTHTDTSTQTHTETSALLSSHHSPPPSYDAHHQHQHVDQHHHQHHHHHDDQGHHRHHHHHHRHREHHDQPDDSSELPVEVIGTPVNCSYCQNRNAGRDHSNYPDSGITPSKIFALALTAGMFVYFFWIWNQAQKSIDRDPWSHLVTNNNNSTRVHHASTSSIKDRTFSILASTPLIDGHNDFAIYIRANYKNNITSHDFRSGFEHGNLSENVDLARLRSGQAGGAFWSAWVGCPPNASFDMSNANYASAVSATLEQIDLIRRLQTQYPRDFTPPIPTALDPSGREHMILQWHATRSLFGPLSIEGLHQIPPTSPFSTLRLYQALGVRMATLTWNCHNAFADASLLWNGWSAPPTVVNEVSRPNEGAITTRGRQVLKEMNRLGIIIDLSHTSYWTQKAVLSADKDGNRLSRAPVVFSHSSAYTLCPHPRNVRDDILDLIPKSKSLVMVNFAPGFISCIGSSDSLAMSSDPHFSLPEFYNKNSTLHQVARHIVYIAERIGYDYVGIGSDFDGMGSEHPRGLDGVDKYPDLVAELLRMGVSDSDARKVVGANLLRVWKDVDDVAAEMAAEGAEPAVDDVYF